MVTPDHRGAQACLSRRRRRPGDSAGAFPLQLRPYTSQLRPRTCGKLGLPYAAARAELERQRLERARTAHERVIGRFFDGEVLHQIPTKKKARVEVLLELLRRFEPGRDYAEPEVNEILGRAHEDVASLRRELVDYRYMTRAGVCRLAERAPRRDPFWAQELPEWEAVWLPGFLAGVSA